MTATTSLVTTAITRYDAEIEAHLRTDHWQNEKNANQDHHPVRF